MKINGQTINVAKWVFGAILAPLVSAGIGIATFAYAQGVDKENIKVRVENLEAKAEAHLSDTDKHMTKEVHTALGGIAAQLKAMNKALERIEKKNQ